MIQPILQTVFQDKWQTLPTVLQRRYANRPFSHDVVTIDGFLTIEMSRLSTLMAPILRLTGTLVPYGGKNIPVTVQFRSERNSNACHFERTFRFSGRAPYPFNSTLRHVGGADLIETMPTGIGWQASYRVDAGMIRLAHRAYRISLFGRTLRLPIEWLFGRTAAEEEAVDDNHFRMAMQIVHPLFGRVYSYHGTFEIISVNVVD